MITLSNHGEYQPRTRSTQAHVQHNEHGACAVPMIEELKLAGAAQ
jgi:hypothetical protein